MAEKIVSPGVFTNEIDQSFLPTAVAEIGAALIGPTLKGPAFVPTSIRTFPEFEEMFGSTDKRYYTPYAVEQYLRSAGTVTIVRVLNTAGYSVDSLAIKIGTTTAAVYASGDLTLTGTIEDNDQFVLVGTDGTYTFIPQGSPGTDIPNVYFFQSGSIF